MAQVRASLPVAPNFIPAIKMTFGASGRLAIAVSSSRSHWIVSIPWAFRFFSTAASLKRATPMIRRVVLVLALARCAMRARVGPIFPATPRITMSPGCRESVAITPAVGSLRDSSSSLIGSAMDDLVINVANLFSITSDGLPESFGAVETAPDRDPVIRGWINRQDGFALKTPTTENSFHSAEFPEVFDQTRATIGVV